MSRVPEAFTCADISSDYLFGTNIVGSPVLKLVVVGQLDYAKMIFGDKQIEVPRTKIYLGSIQFCYPIMVDVCNRPYINIDNVNLETYTGFKSKGSSVDTRLVAFSHKQNMNGITDKITAAWGVYSIGFSALLSMFVLEPTVFMSAVRELCDNVTNKCKDNDKITAFDLTCEILLNEINNRTNPDVFKQMKNKYFVD